MERRKQLIQATASYNSELNRSRLSERKTFFDINTMTIQQPNPKRQAKPPCYRPPLLLAVSKEGFLRFDKRKRSHFPNRSCQFLSETSQADPKYCPFERCVTRCVRIAIFPMYLRHPQCMEMSDEMYATVRTYDWMCMECKPCSICSKLDAEDKMLFCDRCDRGYHTFCVGLSGPPEGPWVCVAYCLRREGSNSGSTLRTDGSSPSPAAAAAATANGLIYCEDCQIVMSKNELHKWKRRTLKDRVLCSQCNRRRRFGE
ncbi:PHD domain containing protein [Trichuris trichiura]|uniref:PHD domain containing protein n=1 Tax=Trichuris trichiura TaxID=36087 RepID=A0A077Z5Q6_TRITR|nr:PHD domain containing protein [Trichuris trichiura]